MSRARSPNRRRAAALLSSATLVASVAVTGAAFATAKTSPSPVAASCGSVPDFAKARFPEMPKLDNKWSPLKPGTQFVLDGNVRDSGGRHSHRIVTTVTDMTKVVDGVRTLIVWDEDFQDGRLAESELFFTAQDTRGNQWLLGEFPAEFDNGTFNGAPSTWLGGTQGSVPGISMPAHPHMGTPGYRQGLAPSVGFLDCAKVKFVDLRISVPAGTFSHVLVTDEWSPLDPTGGRQRKFYAPGVGTVRVRAIGGEARENLKLVSVSRLCAPEQLARVRDRVRELEQLAYRTQAGVFGNTAPAEVRKPAGC